MISDHVTAQLESLGLVLERVHFSSISSHVDVGVADKMGNRWIGTAQRTPHDPNDALQKALEESLYRFNPKWKSLVEKAVTA